MSIIDNIKDVANVVRKADNIELYSQILDLQQEALELLEENHNLKKELQSVHDNKEIKESLFLKEHFYYRKINDVDDGPYCPSCWDDKNKLIRCHISNVYGIDLARCPICNYNSDSF